MEESKIIGFDSQESSFEENSSISCGGMNVDLNKGEDRFIVEPSKIEESKMAIDCRAEGDNDNTGSGISSLIRRKNKGRSRKYDSDGNIRSSYVSRLENLPTPPPEIHLTPSHDDATKRGCGHLKLLDSFGGMHANTTMMDFKAHVIKVSVGEDIIEKILALSSTSPRCITVMSANGTVYNVSVRQPGFPSYESLVKYEGQYDFLRLTGSYTIYEDRRIQTEGFSVMLAGSDGQIVGGVLACALYAATPVQIVLGSYIPNECKQQPKQRHQYGLRKPGARKVRGNREVETSSNTISKAHEPGNKLQAPATRERGKMLSETTDGGTSSRITKIKAKKMWLGTLE